MAGLGLPPKYPRVWGIQIGKAEGGEAKVTGLLDSKDDDTATTAMMTDAEEMFSDSDEESDDGEDYAAENTPRPPPKELLYGGDGESDAERRDVTQVRRPGRSSEAARTATRRRAEGAPPRRPTQTEPASGSRVAEGEAKLPLERTRIRKLGGRGRG